MSHITKLKAKVKFKDKSLLKSALEKSCTSQWKELDHGFVVSINGRNVEFRLEEGEYSPYADRYGMAEEIDALVDKVSGAYIAVAADKHLRSKGYYSTLKVEEDGRIRVSGWRVMQ